MRSSFSISSRVRSIGYAWNGFRVFIKKEPNARIHLAASILLLLGICLIQLTTGEKLFLLLSMFLVWIMELVNSSIEKALDLLYPSIDLRVKYIKDAAAATVLLASINAVVAASVIFIPKLFL